MASKDQSSFFGFKISGYIGDNFKKFLSDNKNVIAQQICMKLRKSSMLIKVLGKEPNCEAINVDDIITGLNRIINNPYVKLTILAIPIDQNTKSQLEPFKTTLISGNILTEEQYELVLHLASIPGQSEQFMRDHPELVRLALIMGAQEPNYIQNALTGLLIILILILMLYIGDYFGFFDFHLPSFIINHKSVAIEPV